MTNTCILKISSDHYYLSQERQISKTNFPKNSVVFLDEKPIFWLCDYKTINNIIVLTILDFYPSDNEITNFANQDFSTINEIRFKSIDWSSLSPFLMMYKKSLLISSEVISIKQSPTLPQIKMKNEDSIFDESFFYPVKNLRFCSGKVVFRKKFSKISEVVDLEIHNQAIIPEMKFIESYLSRRFKNDKIQVVVTGRIRNRELIKPEVRSPQIEMIKENWVYLNKKFKIKKFFKTKFKNSKKTLATIEDIFTDKEREIFKGVDFSIILDTNKLNHNEMLKYLSEKIHNTSISIRFTKEPYFGFIFYHTNESKNIFIWELTENLATYVFSFPKNMFFHQAITTVEKIVSYISQHGREHFLTIKGKAESKYNFKFGRVYHKLNENENINFKNWLEEIEKLLR